MISRFFTPLLILIMTIGVFQCSNSTTFENSEEVPSAWEDVKPGALKDTLKVSTLNMYVGFNVPQLLLADMSQETVVFNKALELLDDFNRSRAELRIEKLAEIILENDIDVVGMQEVTDIYSNDTLLINYTDYLLEKLQELDFTQSYSVYRQRLNDINFVASNAEGDSSVNIRFIEGNAFLYKSEFDLIDSNQLIFQTGLPQVALMDGFVTIERGTPIISLAVNKDEESRTFHFFNTHLEVLRSYSKPQADELLSEANKMFDSSVVQVIFGDMNEVPSKGADTIFTAGGFIDTYGFLFEGNGFTCCMGGETVVAQSAAVLPSSRIDYIYARNITDVLASKVLLTDGFILGSDSLFYPSDHAMVVSEIEFQY